MGVLLFVVLFLVVTILIIDLFYDITIIFNDDIETPTNFRELDPADERRCERYE